MNISPRTKTLLDRLPNHPLSALMRTAMITALAAGEEFAQHKSRLARDGRLTPQGRQEALKAALTNTFGRVLVRAGASVRKARKEITSRRAALTIKPVDPANVSAALERQEIRSWIRQLDLGTRQGVVLSTKDRRILEALLAAPPELSGILDAGLAEKVEQRYLEVVYPAELAELEAMEAVVAEGETALHIARSDMQTVSDLHAHDFSELMRPIEQNAGRPWLLDGDRQVCEIVDGKPRYRVADDSDRANGVRFENFEAYQRANAA
jgi:hypothetical protein